MLTSPRRHSSRSRPTSPSASPQSPKAVSSLVVRRPVLQTNCTFLGRAMSLCSGTWARRSKNRYQEIETSGATCRHRGEKLAARPHEGAKFEASNNASKHVLQPERVRTGSHARNSEVTERPNVSHRPSARNCSSASASAKIVWKPDHQYPWEAFEATATGPTDSSRWTIPEFQVQGTR